MISLHLNNSETCQAHNESGHLTSFKTQTFTQAQKHTPTHRYEYINTITRVYCPLKTFKAANNQNEESSHFIPLFIPQCIIVYSNSK